MASSAALLIGFIRRVPITYWLMDMNPDQVVALGKATPRSALVLALKWLNARIFSRATKVVVLDRYMAERVARQYRVRGKITILPLWSRDEAYTEVSTADNPFRQKYNPEGRLVVMYSGNHSLASPVTTLVQAAVALETNPSFLFMFIGGGFGKREVDETIAARRPTNILSLPYQPLERIKFSLSTADLHVVTLGNEMVGIIHPSKIYGAMGAGRPVLLIGPQPSHASDLIERHGIGWQVEQGDVNSTVATLRQISSSSSTELAEMGKRARAAIEGELSKERLCAAFCDVVEESMQPAPSTIAVPADVSCRYEEGRTANTSTSVKLNDNRQSECF
jgi:glycosyltransferase involved in cell wall biosynthesis